MSDDITKTEEHGITVKTSGGRKQPPKNARKLRDLQRGKGAAQGSNLVFIPDLNEPETAAELIADAAEFERDMKPSGIELCQECSGVLPCGCGWEARY
tara:strand:- start:224 stop:517 length:294 start_codon:yes stop_codon:yes gene_type:complete